MSRVTARLPEYAKRPLRRLRDTLKDFSFAVGTARFCPVCRRTSRRFSPFGAVPRADARCIHCGSLERHRLLWLFMTERTDLFDGLAKRVLHVAPEKCLEGKFKERLGDRYLSADLFNPRAMVRMDITDIQYDDETFDVIYCSHVLEHVPDDRKAMRELYRVLKRTGWAILLVPISAAQRTFEDPQIVDPAERLRLFGQEDHVRSYGPDYVDRLREAGFIVGTTHASDLTDGKGVIRMGLTAACGEIYFCTKHPESAPPGPGGVPGPRPDRDRH